MKLKLIIAGIGVVFLLSSCLKDTPYLTVSNTAPIIQFGLSPANGWGNTLLNPPYFAGDTLGGPTGPIDTAVAVEIASPQVLSQAYTISVNVDTSLVSAYNTQNDSTYSPMPSMYYTLKDTTVTIAAGYRVGRIPISINISALPAHHQYALPLAITNGGGLLISGNSGTFMWMFQR